MTMRPADSPAAAPDNRHSAPSSWSRGGCAQDRIGQQQHAAFDVARRDARDSLIDQWTHDAPWPMQGRLGHRLLLEGDGTLPQRGQLRVLPSRPRGVIFGVDLGALMTRRSCGRRFRARRAWQLDRVCELFPNLGWLAVRDRIHFAPDDSPQQHDPASDLRAFH